MKVFKRSLCIFLSVVVLFFSVNNSYFSPHKMDTVEASSIVVGTTVISIDLIIKVIGALAVAGLAVGVIVEWSDIDMEAVLEDFHSWLQDNIGVLDSIGIDGTSALKEWAMSDTWTVIEGGGGSAPSPSPDNESDTHGLKTALKIGALVGAGGVSLSTALAPISYVSEYGHYVDSEGNILESDDPRIKEIAVDSATLAIAQAYMQSKIDTFGTVNAGTDVITQALQSRYVTDDGNPHYYGSFDIIDGYIQVNAKSQDKDAAGNITVYEISAPCGYRTDRLACFLSDGVLYFYRPYGTNSFDAVSIIQTVTTYAVNGSLIRTDSISSNSIKCDSGYNVNIPIFTNDTAMINYLHGLTDDSSCINRERQQNYIDTSDDYGWASTANITPNDLAAAMPDVAGNLNGRSISLSGVMAAINALKNKLEEDNPNTGVSGDPAGAVLVPYPNVDDYVDALTSVVTDPEIFPRADDIADTDPAPDVDDVVDPAPDTDTMKDYSGLLGLIIGILRNILQAIKDLLGWFIIDFSSIKAHILTALDDVPALTGYEDFLALVDSAKVQITDSYEYPVITIECPEILLPYWKQEQIILLDFEDYATYFIWVRTAMAFAILFGFAVWCVRDIKVSFTLN